MSEHAPVEQPESKPRVTTRRAIVAALVLIPIGIVLAFSLYLADTAGELPWQTDPTRIPVTPFANLPTAVPAASTPVSGS
jgi:hypothetical protein